VGELIGYARCSTVLQDLTAQREILTDPGVPENGSSHWSRVWPTPEQNPRHAGPERWMAAYGHQIVGRPASWFDWRDDNNR